MTPTAPPAADAVADHDARPVAGGVDVVNGGLELLPKQVRAVVEAGRKEPEFHVHPQFFRSVADIHGQDGTGDDVCFLLLGHDSPYVLSYF